MLYTIELKFIDSTENKTVDNYSELLKLLESYKGEEANLTYLNVVGTDV